MTTTHPDPHTCPARGVELRTDEEIEAERQHYRMRCEALGWVVLPGWQPIETAPHGPELLLAVYLEPSEVAQANGSRPHWFYAIGQWVVFTWSSILGSKPTHWMPLPAVPASPA